MWTAIILVCAGLTLDTCNDTTSPFWIQDEATCEEVSIRTMVDTYAKREAAGQPTGIMAYQCIKWEELDGYENEPT